MKSGLKQNRSRSINDDETRKAYRKFPEDGTVSTGPLGTSGVERYGIPAAIPAIHASTRAFAGMYMLKSVRL